MSDTIISEMGLKDKENLAYLVREFALEQSRLGRKTDELLEKSIDTEIAIQTSRIESPYFFGYIAHYKGSPAGFIFGRFDIIVNKTTGEELCDSMIGQIIYVKSEYRRKGIGTDLIVALIDRAKQRNGVDYLKVCIPEWNEGSTAMVSNSGFYRTTNIHGMIYYCKNI